MKSSSPIRTPRFALAAHALSYALPLVLALWAAPAVAQAADPALRWITGVGVNLRSGPSLDSAVLTRLPLNTKVRWQSLNAGGIFCEVETLAAPPQHGYTACRYLSTAALEVAKLGKAVLEDGSANPAYDPYKAFWISPQVRHFLAYAQLLARTQYSPTLEHSVAQQVALGQNVFLPPHPDLERMKQRLADAPPHAADAAAGAASGRFAQPIQWPELPSGEIALLPVRPSFFQSDADLAPPQASLFDLSAHWSIPLSFALSSGVQFQSVNVSGDVFKSVPAVWDVNGITGTLKRPVRRVSIARTGSIKAQADRRADHTFAYEALSVDSNCEGVRDGFQHSTSSARHAATPAGTASRLDRAAWLAGDEDIIELYVRAALPQRNARIAAATLRAAAGEIRKPGFSAARLWHIDLDHDGVADLAVWEGYGKTNIEHMGDTMGDWPYLRISFANIAGQWRLLTTDHYSFGCGC